jgi:hypothetical protein
VSNIYSIKQNLQKMMYMLILDYSNWIQPTIAHTPDFRNKIGKNGAKTQNL